MLNHSEVAKRFFLIERKLNLKKNEHQISET